MQVGRPLLWAPVLRRAEDCPPYVILSDTKQIRRTSSTRCSRRPVGDVVSRFAQQGNASHSEAATVGAVRSARSESDRAKTKSDAVNECR